MKYIQKKCAALVIGMSFVLCSYMNADDEEMSKTNEIGQEVWRSKSADEYLKKETKDYNRSSFESKLSQLGWFEYKKLSKDQRQTAMKIADGSSYSPDAAVFMVSSSF